MPDDQQTTVSTATPPVAGPFTSYLDPSQVSASTLQGSNTRPSGFMGRGGKIALFVDKFLEGASQGRAIQYAKAQAKDQAIANRITEAMQYVSNSDLDPAVKKQEMDRLWQLKIGIVANRTGPDAAGGTPAGGTAQPTKKKKSDSQQQQNPILNFVHQAASNMLGPKADPSMYNEQYVRATLGDISYEVQKAQSQTAQVNQLMSNAQSMLTKGLQDGSIKSRPDIAKNQELAQTIIAISKANNGKLPQALSDMIKDVPEKAEPVKTGKAVTNEGKVINLKEVAGRILGDDDKEVDLKSIKPGSIRWGNEPRETTTEEKRRDAQTAFASKLGKNPENLTPEERNIVDRLQSNTDLSERVETNLSKQKGEKNLVAAWRQANQQDRDEKTRDKNAKAYHETLLNTMAKLAIEDRKNKDARYSPREASILAHGIINDITADDPTEQTQIDAMRKSAADPKDPNRVASAVWLQKRALKDLQEGHPELSDIKRQQLSAVINGFKPGEIEGNAITESNVGNAMNVLRNTVGQHEAGQAGTTPPPLPKAAGAKAPPANTPATAQVKMNPGEPYIEDSKGNKQVVRDGKWVPAIP